FQHGNAMVPIELKYKTRKLSLEISGETYSLRNHSAQDTGRYDFIKDISRLEAITASYPEALGYAILLTNEGAYWKGKSSKRTVDAAFRLHEDRVLAGECAWSKRPSAGTTKG